MKKVTTNRNELVPWILRPGYAIIMFFQNMLNKMFSPNLNPMYLLGATNFFLFWILLATGIYIFLFFDMAPAGAYDAAQSLSIDQKYYGGIFRSMHRYAADLLIITITLHMLHVIFMDRFRRTRSLAWYIGVAMVPVIWLAGLTGYFLVWDQKAQVLTLYIAQAFDLLGLSAEPVVRNFLYNESVSRMLFFLMTFTHIMIPAIILIGAWVHCIRVSRPLIGPPKELAIPIMIYLVVLSVLQPALSTGKADLTKLVTSTEFDWFYMYPIALPEMLGVSPGVIWASSVILLAVLFFLPFLIFDGKKKAEQASGNLT
jgi:hypothetical protein